MSISWQSVGEITITGDWSGKVSSVFLLYGIRILGVFRHPGCNVTEGLVKMSSNTHQHKINSCTKGKSEFFGIVSATIGFKASVSLQYVSNSTDSIQHCGFAQWYHVAEQKISKPTGVTHTQFMCSTERKAG